MKVNEEQSVIIIVKERYKKVYFKCLCLRQNKKKIMMKCVDI